MHKHHSPEDPVKHPARLRWSDCLREDAVPRQKPSRVIGVLTGEGIGPEVIGCALHVLSAVESATGRKFKIEFGAPIGREAERGGGKVLPDEVIEFCRGIFARGGAVLNGPGGGRYVYDLRRVFDLFCKLSPLKVSDELAGANRMKPEHVRGVDILMVRENASGLYQGKWTEARTTGGRVAEHCFSYSEAEVRRILRLAAAVANSRRGQLTVVYKEAGVPSISALWRDCALEISTRAGVRCSLLDIDHIAYRLIQHPGDFDVVVAPNLFGDVLSDLGGVLLGSRGLCFGGSFAGNGDAVYSTNHGAAYDLAGSDKANPVAQILSLAMLLRESLHLEEEARLIEDAVDSVCRQGWRTVDLAEAGCPVIGTREMGERIAQAVATISGANDVQIGAPRMRVRSRTRNQGPQSNCDEGLNHAPATHNEVSRMAPFLLLVDLQHDYLRAAGLVPAADEIVDRAAVLLQGCRAANIPVAHVWTTVSRADDQRMPHWKRLDKWMCVDGTPGHAPPAPLRPETSEPVIHKRFFSAFSSGTLAPMLTARGVDTLIVAGIHLHGCVRQTVLAAYEKGFDIWVADDAVGSDDPLHAAITRRYLQSRAARFASVAELLAMLNGPTQAPTTALAPCSRSTKRSDSSGGPAASDGGEIRGANE